MHIFKNTKLQEAVKQIQALYRQAKEIHTELEREHAISSREKYISLREDRVNAFNEARAHAELAAYAAKHELQQRANELKAARIKPSEDINLLQLSLSAEELALVIERNAGNDVFIRTAIQYAEARGIHSPGIDAAMKKHHETFVDYDEVVRQVDLYLRSRIPVDGDIFTPDRLAMLNSEFNILTEDGGLLAKYDAML